jgi:OOP family OmpA-OmpF porin
MWSKQRLLMLSAGLLSVLIAGQAAAQLPITIHAGLGQWNIDDDRGLKDTSTPWLGAEYGFGERWAAEIMYAEDESRYRDGPKADIATWQLGALYYLDDFRSPDRSVTPYLALSGGEIDIDAGDFDTVETTVALGGGLRWMLTDRFGLRAEARMLHSLDESHNDWLFTAGLNYYLGKLDTTKGAGVMTGAAMTAADIDSDGDGVFDDKDRCPDTPAGTRVDAVGCPLPVAKVASIKLKVNFEFDSSVVEERYFSDLQELADFLKRFTDLQVDVEGHTDSTGPESYNELLSQQRAQAVVDLLVNQYGIEARRLEAKGYGESQPVASNDTREGRAQNRRVMATLEVEYEE